MIDITGVNRKGDLPPSTLDDHNPVNSLVLVYLYIGAQHSLRLAYSTDLAHAVEAVKRGAHVTRRVVCALERVTEEMRV